MAYNIHPAWYNFIQIIYIRYAWSVNFEEQSDDFIDKFDFFNTVFDECTLTNVNVFVCNRNDDC